MKTLLLSATALVMLGACSPKTTAGVSATEEAMCDAWQDSLPTRSNADTQQTVAEIGRTYDVFEAVCQREVR